MKVWKRLEDDGNDEKGVDGVGKMESIDEFLGRLEIRD